MHVRNLLETIETIETIEDYRRRSTEDRGGYAASIFCGRRTKQNEYS